MDNSVYVALSKQTAAGRQLDVIANNIANANTTGYKGESIVFSEYLNKGDKQKTSYANDLGNTSRDFSQGSLETTGNPLDLAIQGKGYFGVQTPQGERYTRAGNFMINDQAELVTSEGYQVMDQAGSVITFQPEDTKIVIYADGRLEVNDEDRGTIGVFDFESNNSLTKIGNNLFASSRPAAVVDDPKIAQGMLEKSNVNSIAEMTKMLGVQRDYDRTSKFINGIYELQESAIRTLAKE